MKTGLSCVSVLARVVNLLLPRFRVMMGEKGVGGGQNGDDGLLVCEEDGGSEVEDIVNGFYSGSSSRRRLGKRNMRRVR